MALSLLPWKPGPLSGSLAFPPEGDCLFAIPFDGEGGKTLYHYEAGEFTRSDGDYVLGGDVLNHSWDDVAWYLPVTGANAPPAPAAARQKGA